MQETSGILEINGTIVAVFINFAILIWIVNKFLFKPIGKVIAERENKISGDISAAEKQLEEAKQFNLEAKAAIQKARNEAQDAILKGGVEAQKLKAELEQRAREEMERQRLQMQETLSREKEQFYQGLRNEVIELSIKTAEKVIRNNLDEKTKGRLLQSGIDDLKIVMRN